jgi:GntR family transcriptional regulator
MMWHNHHGPQPGRAAIDQREFGVAPFADVIGRLDEQSRAPLYQQLQRALRDAIEDNRLTAEEALPPERELADQLGISRITVRKALDSLVADGLLTRRQGAGTFVAPRTDARVEKSFSKLSSFSEDMISRGRHPESVWLSRSCGAVTPEESLTLGLSPGSKVYRFNRIRYADGEPMALEHSTIAGFCLPDEMAVGDSLYETLGRFSSRPVRALQRLRAVLFTGERAKLLGLEEGVPGLFIERRGFLKDGRVAEVTHSYYRGDAYDFVAELNTTAS